MTDAKTMTVTYECDRCDKQWEEVYSQDSEYQGFAHYYPATIFRTKEYPAEFMAGEGVTKWQTVECEQVKCPECGPLAIIEIIGVEHR